MRKIMVSGLVLFLGVLGLWQPAVGQAALLKITDFRIGKLHLEQPISEVIQIYGKPVRIGRTVVYKDHINASLWRRYYFNGIELEVSGTSKKVYDIAVFNPELKTPRNVGVGSLKTDVIGRYGKADEVDEYLIYEMYDNKSGSTYMLVFAMASSRVARVNLYFAWD